MDILAVNMRWDGKVSRIITTARIRQSKAFCIEHGYPLKPPVEVRALWDTGAEGTCISEELARELGLKLMDDAMTVNGVYGSAFANVYDLDVVLSEEITVANILAPEINNNKDFDIIIGMNIINLGTFIITNKNGNTTLYFSVPVA
jgi:predicted aspartyl protease